MARVAILFDNFGPYHLARLTAAAGACDLLAIEIARRSDEYAWDTAPGQLGFQSECLFEGTSSKLDAASIAKRLELVFGRFKPEAVVVPGWASRTSLCSVAWCLKRRLPLVVMSDSQAKDKLRKGWREAVKRQIVGCFSAALAGGIPHADYLAQLGLPRERVFLGYDAVDNSYFAKGAKEVRGQMPEGGGQGTEDGSQRSVVRKKHGLPERFFLVSARFIEEKNLPRLLEAYARYRTLCGQSVVSGPMVPWSLVVLGDGPLRDSLNSQLSILNLHGHVQMPGFKQYPDLPVYYELAEALILPSVSETWGLVVNEAMASGLPVLVSNRCGCAPDLVQEGVNGFTFDPLDVEQLARLMLKMSAFQPFSLSTFGDASRAIISEWGTERFASGLKAAVDKALEVGPLRPSLLQRTVLTALLWR
jgi:glycosyltransferase involved in cell wall biosynthesis